MEGLNSPFGIMCFLIRPLEAFAQAMDLSRFRFEPLVQLLVLTENPTKPLLEHLLLGEDLAKPLLGEDEYREIVAGVMKFSR
jgi:hypothetical protein